MAASTLSMKVNGALSACSQFAGGSWVTTKTCSPAAGLPSQPLVRCGFRCIDHPNDLQLDPRQQHLEQPTVTTEQQRDAGAVDR
jgi:hypothetical protein